MRKEQPPARLNSEQTVTFDANTMMEKNNGWPPLPKTLNHYFSESTYKRSYTQTACRCLSAWA